MKYEKVLVLVLSAGLQDILLLMNLQVDWQEE